MKKSATFILFPFLCLLPPLAGAQAAGVNKVLLFTLNDDQVAGYVATPGPGWSNWVDVGAASPASAARQEFYAIFRQPSNPWSSSPRVTPPAPAALTRIGPKGGILSKELLPAAIQVVQSECTLPPGGNICPDVFATATTVKSLPGKLVIYASKHLYSGGYF